MSLRLVCGDLRFPVARSALAPLDLFRAQPALLEGRSYALKARVSQEVLEGFVAVLYDPSENVDITWRNAGEFRSLAQELGFHGFDAQLERAELSRPGGETGGVPLDVEMYKRQIEAHDARIFKLEAQIAEGLRANEELRREVQLVKSSAVPRSNLSSIQESVETAETRKWELYDSFAYQRGDIPEKLSWIEAVTKKLSAAYSTANILGSSEKSGSEAVETDRLALIATDVEANGNVAEFFYGLCAEFGFGSECNLEEAVKLYKAAADQGNT